MPLYLQLIDLLKIEYAYVHNLQKEYKYSLGEDVIHISWELVDLFIRAQTHSVSSGERKETISEIAQKFDCLKIRIRFLSELNQISLRQTAKINEQLVVIGKMIGSWQKNVKNNIYRQ